MPNKGYDKAEIDALKKKLQASQQNFLMNEEEENSEEFANFYFVGSWEGKEVIFDAALYTLRLHHQSELYEAAELKAEEKYPEYKALKEVAGDAEPELPEELEEEVGWYITETMFELEEEESVKVAEHLEIDTNIEFGLSLNASLNVDNITPQLISEFIDKFNSDSLELDETYYSFQTIDEDEEEEGDS